MAAVSEVEIGPYGGREPQGKKTLNHGMKAETLNKSKLTTEAYRSLERNKHGSSGDKAPEAPAWLWGSCAVSERLDPRLAAQGLACSWGSVPVEVFSQSPSFVLVLPFFSWVLVVWFLVFGFLRYCLFGLPALRALKGLHTSV